MDAILFFTIGGLVMSVLAGTRLVNESRRWWQVAVITAIVAGAVDIALGFRTEFMRHGALHHSEPVLRLLFCTANTLMVAGVARILARHDWPGLVRTLVCLIFDLMIPGGLVFAFLAIRWGAADAVFIMLCVLADCDV